MMRAPLRALVAYLVAPVTHVKAAVAHVTTFAASPAALIAFLVLIVGCSPAAGRSASAETPSTTRLETALDPGTANPYARADAPRTFVFPADHAAHPQFRHEWWYLTGHLDAASGQRFGFEVTFFRLALQPPSQPLAGDSHWRTSQLYAAHFALTDPERRVFHSTERFARDALGLAGAHGTPLRVSLDDWSLTLPQGASEPWRLSAHDGPYRLELNLQPQGEPALNGDRGLSRKSSVSSAASYYYSIPRLAVSGTLVRDATPMPIIGSAWLDREWGSDGLAPDEAGWDWFALQLEDGSAVMFYALRLKDGSRDAASAGTFVDASGAQRQLSSADVRIATQREWRSPRGGTYPLDWHFEIASLGLDLQLHPVLDNQELDTRPRYWEGAVDIRGSRSGKPLQGRGYVELTGYANAPADARIRAQSRNSSIEGAAHEVPDHRIADERSPRARGL
ncbi:MAG TPA: lipocalin-like domain-containing protein [Steroidobacteraceae bacterium]|nr:lipocalin-like domain-containing protein [Steroidobacteraceae bacterium]